MLPNPIVCFTDVGTTPFFRLSAPDSTTNGSTDQRLKSLSIFDCPASRMSQTSRHSVCLVCPQSSVFEPRTLVHSWRLQCKQLGNDSTVFGQCFSPELVSPQRKRHTADTLRPAKWLLSKVLEYVPAYRPSVESSDCFASSEFTLADETLSSTLARSLDLLNLAYREAVGANVRWQSVFNARDDKIEDMIRMA